MQKLLITLLAALVACASVSYCEKPPSSIHPLSASPRLPFPQHTPYTSGIIKPSNVTQEQLDDSTRTFYDRWKHHYLKNDCGMDQYYVMWDEGGSTICVSEAQGYAMMITAVMAGYDPDAQLYFDQLYAYCKAHPSAINNRLMVWRQVTGCLDDTSGGGVAATDGDMDIAFALLLADNQWGSNGSLNYLAEARAIIGAILQDEINPATSSIKLGDWSNSSEPFYYYGTRPSDFMTDHFRAFLEFTGDARWTTVIDKCFSLDSIIQADFSPATGLLPDFIQHVDTSPIPAAPNYMGSPDDGYYYYNACRIPWRLATDYLMSAEPRAKATVDKVNTWITSSTGGDPGKIRAGYKLDGADVPGNDYLDLSFTAPFAVGAMVDSSNQDWLDALWNLNVHHPLEASTYYENTLKMLAMIVISGNWWKPGLGTEVEEGEAISRNFSLGQNYPNPFNPKTVISYSLSVNSFVSLGVYDVLGREVASLINDYNEPGEYKVSWDATNYSNGVYIYRLQAHYGIETKKMLLLK